MNDDLEVDLDAYFARIGYRGAVFVSPQSLAALHFAHATHIPFENLDVLLGVPVRLDAGALQDKLVSAHRGGYCFEQNTLFAMVLRQLGFSMTMLAARVRFGTDRLLPRTHMLLRVHFDEGDCLADVGFGGWGLLEPLPFVFAEPCRQGVWHYRLQHDGRLAVLQSLQNGRWLDLYAFSDEPQHAVDYGVANYYVSTHPDSRFTSTLTAQRVDRDVRYVLRNRELTIDRASASEVCLLDSDKSLIGTLESLFGLCLDDTAKALLSHRLPL